MRMIRRKMLRSLLGVALFASATASGAGSPPTLTFDPFRPKPPRVEVTRTTAKPPQEQAFNPILLSTVVGGENPLVNFGGEILAIGEEIHGYRLVKIGVFDATFTKDGKTLRLEVVSGERVDQ